MKKYIVIITLLIASVLSLVGCGVGSAKTNETLKVGVTSGPHEEIMKEVQKIAKTEGLDIKLIPFNDYIQPNIQLNEKAIDANVYQHEPFLKNFNAAHKMNLVSAAPAVNFPMGIYSRKVKKLSELKYGARVGVPNDATNEARALMLLEAAKVITLKSGIGDKATIKDVVKNSKNIKLVELEAPMLVRSLSDLDAAAINTNFIMSAGMTPSKDAIYLEPKNSPWVNIIATRPDLKNDTRIKKLIKIYHSAEIKKFILSKYKGSVVPAF
ncbi:MAG: MetQ/NlpA family ABC transporter substrate-binding protein [Clostridium sp.]|nr:MetQ/NlpA family ABC transporter substrate-binding protein [Clostridium sp.]